MQCEVNNQAAVIFCLIYSLGHFLLITLSFFWSDILLHGLNSLNPVFFDEINNRMLTKFKFIHMLDHKTRYFTREFCLSYSWVRFHIIYRSLKNHGRVKTWFFVTATNTKLGATAPLQDSFLKSKALNFEHRSENEIQMYDKFWSNVCVPKEGCHMEDLHIVQGTWTDPTKVFVTLH